MEHAGEMPVNWLTFEVCGWTEVLTLVLWWVACCWGRCHCRPAVPRYETDGT